MGCPGGNECESATAGELANVAPGAMAPAWPWSSPACTPGALQKLDLAG
jgi:hypothetical protein